jgi:hypothetical protein
MEFSHLMIMKHMKLFFSAKTEHPALFKEYSVGNLPHHVSEFVEFLYIVVT